MTTAIIIEDERYIAKDLRDKIYEIDPEIRILEILSSLKTAKRWLLQNPEPDLMLMDIQLGDGISFELFDQYSISCPVIFTTAFDEFALKAFKANGMDYLLKPIDKVELKAALDKCKRMLMPQNLNPGYAETFSTHEAIGPSRASFKGSFIVSYRNHWIPIKTSEIALFRKDKLNYVYKFSGEKYHLDYNTLEEIEEVVNPSVFYRANRQFIIHIDSIKSIELKENNKLKVYLNQSYDNVEIEISREKAPSFKKWLSR